MSTQYNGLPANVSGTLPASVNIASSTNANPIALVTASPHGMTTGDKVNVSGHRTNTSANGIWTATVTGGSAFTIPVAGIGVGGATGTAQPLSAGATFAIPSAGDARTASSVNVPLEAVADRTSFLVANTGAYKLAALGFAGVLNGSLSASIPTFTTAIGLTPPVVTGDIVELDIAAIYQIPVVTGTVDLVTGIAIAAPGAAAPALATLTGGGGFVTGYSATTSAIACASMMSVTAPVASSGVFYVGLGIQPQGGLASVTYSVCPVRFRIWRPTGVGQ